jgi:electron transfer flavoprotein beta subunit
MRIIVPIKQVPDITEVSVNEETGTLIREGIPSTLNPFCEFAVEAAIELKEKHGGEVIVLTMGPPQASDALHKALAMGADRAIHLTDRDFAGADTWATAFTLAEQIKRMGPFDLIICGKQAIDGDTAQVGPELAELLGIPQICYVRYLEITENGKTITAHRETNEGYEIVRARIPVLITATKGLNIPRLPDLLRMGKPVEVVNATMLGIEMENLGLKGSRTTVKKVFPPERRKSGIIVDVNDSKEAAKQLIEYLIKKGVIKA